MVDFQDVTRRNVEVAGNRGRELCISPWRRIWMSWIWLVNGVWIESGERSLIRVNSTRVAVESGRQKQEWQPTLWLVEKILKDEEDSIEETKPQTLKLHERIFNAWKADDDKEDSDTMIKIKQITWTTSTIWVEV